MRRGDEGLTLGALGEVKVNTVAHKLVGTVIVEVVVFVNCPDAVPHLGIHRRRFLGQSQFV